MINHCKGCNRHETTNDKMRAYGKNEIVGDYCLKFQWNLLGMTKFPDKCYEGGNKP